MTNDFATIDAQDATSRMAQLTTEEQAEANQYYDELNAKLDDEQPISPAGEQANRESWQLLASIHDELAPVMATIRAKEDILESL